MASKKKAGGAGEGGILSVLEKRFAEHPERHGDIAWTEVGKRLAARPEKLASLRAMEESGGEPDLIGRDGETGELLFCDCSPESPEGRRSLCYDRAALEARKEAKPADSVLDRAAALGVELLGEEDYRRLQRLGEFDRKTSSWLRTPEEVRKRGGALFGDLRYGRVFVYHNGAESYYAARGFRGLLRA